MIQLDKLGLMTFPRASERWNKERSYVYQQYKKYPEKFLPGSTAYLNGSGSGGTLIITREGMEHLTGQTEAEASNELWEVIVMKQSNIIEQKQAISEDEILEQMFQLVDNYASDEMVHEEITYDYLDEQRKNFGIRLKNGMTIYYRNIRRQKCLPDELKENDVVAHRCGKQFGVEEIGGYPVAEISLEGEIVLYNFHNPDELVKQVQRLAARIRNYSKE